MGLGIFDWPSFGVCAKRLLFFVGNIHSDGSNQILVASVFPLMSWGVPGPSVMVARISNLILPNETAFQSERNANGKVAPNAAAVPWHAFSGPARTSNHFAQASCSACQ